MRKTYQDKLVENERTVNRWLSKLTRATNKLERLRLQRVRLLKALEKNQASTRTEIAQVDAAASQGAAATPPPPRPKKKGKPERRINV